MPEHYGLALRRLRQLSDMTQAEVAKRSGCSKAQISRYELGRSGMRINTLVRVLRAMNCTLRDFGYAMQHVKQYPPAE